MKWLFATAAVATAVTAVSATPAQAKHRHHHSYKYYRSYAPQSCVKWRHHHCVAVRSRGHAYAYAYGRPYRVGYRFGPSYGYTPYGSLPPAYVSQYSLNPDYRYVYRNDRIYVVDPQTYAVTRIINALTR